MVLLLLVEVEAEDGAMELRQQRRWKVQGRRGMVERGSTKWIWMVGSRRTTAAQLQRLRSVVRSMAAVVPCDKQRER